MGSDPKILTILTALKTGKYQKRFYRDLVKAKDLYCTRVIEQETDLQILTDKLPDKGFIKERIRFYRRQIANYISRDKRFMESLKPVTVEMRAPLIVRRMSKAASAANVGPMAAVAGAIAQFIGKDLIKKGFREVIVENGGDIFLKTGKTRNIGIYSGKSSVFNRMFLEIKPGETPLAVCASSGTIGHSLSFGRADCVIILSSDAALADAVATSTCNMIWTKPDLKKAMEFARSVRGVRGCVIIFKDSLISWGKICFAHINR